MRAKVILAAGTVGVAGTETRGVNILAHLVGEWRGAAEAEGEC